MSSSESRARAERGVAVFHACLQIVAGGLLATLTGLCIGFVASVPGFSGIAWAFGAVPFVIGLAMAGGGIATLLNPPMVTRRGAPLAMVGDKSQASDRDADR